MNKLESVIARYEKARSLVCELSFKRSSLIRECECVDTSEDNHGLIVEIGMPCGAAAFEYMVNHNKGELYQEDRITFDDAFFNYINNDEGACDKCLEAMKIKRNELAAAKKEFGAAKRSISYHGKRLITEHCRSLDDK